MTTSTNQNFESKTIAIVYYSRYHHIETIANNIKHGIVASGLQCTLIPVETATEKIDIINASDAIIFGTPTYFGNMASELKAFFDTTSQIWVQQKWRNKIAAAFTHSSTPSGDKLNTLQQITVFALQHGMIWGGLDIIGNSSLSPEISAILELDQSLKLNRLGSWTGLMTQLDSAPPNAEMMAEDLATASYFGYRIASVVKAFCHDNTCDIH